MAKNVKDSAFSAEIMLYNSHGQAVGRLDRVSSRKIEGEVRCELVAISLYTRLSSRNPNWTLSRFNDRKDRKDQADEEYNVLWIEWVDGIAYRRGIGRVHKEAWDQQELEWIDLTLG